MREKFTRWQRVYRWAIYLLIGLAAAAAGGFAWISLHPDSAAQGADVLRSVFGDEAVAQIETVVYQTQDTLLQAWYRLGGRKPATPWVSAPVGPVSAPILPAGAGAIAQAATTSSPPKGSIQSPAGTRVSAGPTPTGRPNPTPLPTAEPPWMPAAVIPMGNLEGEAQWSPYLTDARGKTVAYRAYLQPDPGRAYALVGVVAFDLRSVRLNFVLGLDEPFSEVKYPRTGLIPVADRRPGILLAVFNGGFKYRHGRFGVKVDGTTINPPKTGIGTLGFYSDGRIVVAEWGTELSDSPDLPAYRQNGPLVVHHGEVNPRVADDDPQLWGYTVKEMAPIWRSGIGTSADGRTLYYLAGPSITLPVLAKAMSAAGLYNAIQLDINNYWVHFDAVQSNGSKFSTTPLFEEMGRDFCDRYLQPYTRDFFYVTTR